MLAFVEKEPILGSSPLRWFTLPGLEGSTWNPGGKITQLAIAPDDRRIAMFIQNRLSGEVVILDTATQEVTRLLDLGDARGLVWDPEGDLLAMIGRSNPEVFSEDAIVVDVSAGGVIFRKSIDFHFDEKPNWPFFKEGIDFPALTPDVEDCARVPEPVQQG